MGRKHTDCGWRELLAREDGTAHTCVLSLSSSPPIPRPSQGSVLVVRNWLSGPNFLAKLCVSSIQGDERSKDTQASALGRPLLDLLGAPRLGAGVEKSERLDIARTCLGAWRKCEVGERPALGRAQPVDRTTERRRSSSPAGSRQVSSGRVKSEVVCAASSRAPPSVMKRGCSLSRVSRLAPGTRFTRS